MHHKHVILGVHVTDRVKRAQVVQELFSEYGCNIKTRLGLHHVTEEVCGTNGLILLEMWGDEDRCMELKDRLNEVEGLEAKAMVFDHPLQ